MTELAEIRNYSMLKSKVTGDKKRLDLWRSHFLPNSSGSAVAIRAANLFHNKALHNTLQMFTEVFLAISMKKG